MDKDYYAILQVSPGAEREVIDGAYIRLTHKYHPDISSTPDAADRMKAINEAYDVLSNPLKRAVYDQARKTTPQPTLIAEKNQDSRLARIIEVLELELNQGCNDDTLLGGLEGFVRNWARQFAGEPKEVCNTAISIAAFVEDYGHLPRDERRQAVSQALARARNELVPPWRIRRLATPDEMAHGPIVVRPEPQVDLAKRVTLSSAPYIPYPRRFTLNRKWVLIAGIVVTLLVGAVIIFQVWVNQPFATCPQGCVTKPPNCAIKGNINSVTGEKIYHKPGGEFYDQTTIDPRNGERWFCTEDEAIANGWRPSQK